MLSKPKARRPQENVRDKFLSVIRDSGEYVTIELGSRTALRRIIDFDMYCVLVESRAGAREVIFKHAIIMIRYANER